MNCSIVTYRTSREMLNKVVGATLENKLLNKLFIIDNSPDEVIASYLIKSEKIVYINTGKNIGYGAGHNIAISVSIQENTEYHIVINPDIYFQTGTLDRIIEYMRSKEDVGLLMPMVLFPNGEIQYLCKLLPTPADWIFRRFLPFKNYINRRNDKFELRFTGYNTIMNVPYLSGCFMAFRTKILKEIGLFDENIFMYGEDTDITRRIRKKYKTIFFPDISVYHEHQKESYKNFRLLKIHIKAAICYFNKWGWFFDKERREINRKVLNELGYRK
ncbi:MAG: glycosyltransferase [Bacteroidia bacterium]|nr:glycosyltransferase [Bacteroidia bacterium]